MSSIKHQAIEKRKYTRFPAVNEYILTLNGTEHHGVIGNISLGGVYLKTILPKITYDNLFHDCEIKMNLAGTDIIIPCSISFIASESSKIPDGAGIAFSNIDDNPPSLLANYIDKIQHSLELHA